TVKTDSGDALTEFGQIVATACGSLRRRTLADAHQIIGPYPLAKRRLHVLGAKVDVAMRRDRGLIERQAQVAAPEQTACDPLNARLAQRNLSQQQRLDAHELVLSDGRRLHRGELADDDVGGLG